MRKPICSAAAMAVVIAAGALAEPAGARQGRPPGRPSLLVMLVIDQFGADDVDRYEKQWTHGLRRLLDSGAVFTNAAYPYGGTVTCPGHTSIGSGTVPATHGMIGNNWYDRDSRKTVACTDDVSVASVAFGGGTGTERHSPRWMMTSSFADELRRQMQPAPRILSISLKPRSAIGMAGHGGANTYVVWEEDNGTFATSTAYTTAPWPDVDRYVASHPIGSAYGQIWRRLLPLTSYQYEDNAPGEAMPDGWGRTFPHRLLGDWDVPDAKFVTVWEHSPWSDAYLADMAMSLTQTLQLGRRGTTDMLALSLSALDLVGHSYGPRSHEVQDVLARADVLIGRLLDVLDRSVGADRYTIALSADHGAPPLPEQAAELGVDAGRIPALDIRLRIQAALAPFVAADTATVAAVSDPNIYFEAAANNVLRATPAAQAAVTAALRSIKGIAGVYWADDLAAKDATEDPILRAMRASYVPGRSGDLQIVPQPYWIVRPSGTTHGSPHEYDRRVPLILAGAHVVPGRYTGDASPVDIAPTFAALAGITLTRTDGKELKDAVRR